MKFVIVKKAYSNVADALTIIALGYSCYVLGKLAYDWTQYGVEVYKAKKA